MKPRLHFFGVGIGNLKTIHRILDATDQYSITSDYYDIDLGTQFDTITGVDYLVTSHRTPPRDIGIRLIHVGHGTGPITLKREGAAVEDLVCVCGQDFADQYIAMGIMPGKILNIGMPYSIDFLGEDPEGRRQFLLERRQNPDKKTILYAPTWNHTEPRGFFVLWQDKDERELVEEFCRYITEDLDCNLLVRFHEHFRYSKNWLHEEYRDILNKYGVYAIYYPEDMDDVPFIKYSDMLVGDMSSINTCFYIADKPVVLIGNDIFKVRRLKYSGVRMSDRKNAGFVTDDFYNLLSMIKDSLEYPDRYQFGRKVFVKKYIDYVGEASRQAVINEFSRIILK